MNRIARLASVIALAFALLAPFAAAAATVSQTFDHQLLVNQPPQSWEHRIDLPDAQAFAGEIFVKRDLAIDGRLVIEREILTPTYYYVKVRLPKHPSEPMRGILKVTLDTAKNAPVTPVLAPVTDLKLITDAAPVLRPVFAWKGDGRFAAVTLYDLDLNQTVMERVQVNHKAIQFTEGWLQHHHYRWAVKQSDETGRYSKEVQAGFRIEKVNGVVVAIPE